MLPGEKASNIRGDGYGGSIISWNQDYFTCKEHIIINQDSTLIKVTLANNRSAWIGSIYLPRKKKKDLLDLFGAIKEKVPEHEWSRMILGGDWNIDLKNEDKDKLKETLLTICKQMGLQTLTIGGTRKEKALDFFVVGRDINLENIKSTQNHLSDHAILLGEVTIPKPRKNQGKFKIPNRKMACDLTQKALKESTNTKKFLQKIDRYMALKNYSVLKTVKPKPRNRELLNKIIQIQDEDEDIERVTNNYWKELSENNEKSRFSQESKEAFAMLKRIYKYHEFDKKDGSIVSRILMEDGSIEDRKEEVAKILIEELKKAQVLESEPLYTKPLPFPKLPDFTWEDTYEIIQGLSHGKAIAFDGVADILFTKGNSKKSAKILKDLWSVNWEETTKNPNHFQTRMIPLNKMHPHTPTKEKFRPISVASPLVKILEARLQKKLYEYMKEKLHRGQTGFVPGMGITVNQMRLVERVTERFAHNRPTYGLFLDFSNAYNTILHNKLFQRLETVLTEDEIKLIQAIYSRIEITLDQEKFTPNTGVAQGSIISPALFNISRRPPEDYRRHGYKYDGHNGICRRSADDLFLSISAQRIGENN